MATTVGLRCSVILSEMLAQVNYNGRCSRRDEAAAPFRADGGEISKDRITFISRLLYLLHNPGINCVASFIIHGTITILSWPTTKSTTVPFSCQSNISIESF